MEAIETQLCDWYVGERAGEAYFAALANRAPSERERDKWHLLAELERVTGDRLLAELQRRNVAEPDAVQAIAKKKAQVAGAAAASWAVQMKTLQPALVRYVETFRAAAASVPPEAAEITAMYIAHEVALLEFVDAELRSDDGSPAITRLLPDARASIP